MVPAARLELARPHQALDFESNASTDSTTRACVFLKRERIIEVEQGIFNHAFQETRRTGFLGDFAEERGELDGSVPLGRSKGRRTKPK